jgi:molybdopterin-containing oxidoreductase family iron-sulfur binding subunit
MKKYWRSIEEYKSQLATEQDGNLPPQATFSADHLEGGEDADSHSRRDFLKMLGFGLGYVGLVSSCEMPVRKAIPYLNQPEQVVPGVSNFYATSYFDGHDYCSLLVKSRDGRPIKIEGNVMSPVTKGGTHARVQASVLDLYDMNRLKGPMKNNQAASWETIDQEVSEKLESINASGERIVILSHTVISPATVRLINQFKEKYPTTEWVVYDSISSSAILMANQENFNIRAIPDYHFDRADLIVSFNADFLGNWLSPVEYTKDYVRKRRLTDAETEMARHYQFESWMSLTGSKADYRIPIKPSEEGVILMNLYNAIAMAKGAPEYQSSPPPIDLTKVTNELLASEGHSLVVCGTNDPDLQKIVNAINYLLGNYGETIDFDHPLMTRQGCDQKLSTLVEDMNSGNVGAIILYNVNPVYDYPESEKFINGMKNTGLSISLSDRLDESAQNCHYICTDCHYLESWNDAEPKKGIYSMQQPLIRKVFDSRQAQESFMKWIGLEPDFLTYLEKFWKEEMFLRQDRFLLPSEFWNHAVHDGVVELKADPPDIEYSATELKIPTSVPGDGYELVLYEKIGVGTGKNANNPWLQELPDPITRSTWDNYLCVPPSLADDQGWEQGDVVAVSGSVELPVLVQPGQPEGTVAVALGYGRTSAGKVANGIGKNAYPLMTFHNGTKRATGERVKPGRVPGKNQPLALVQMHHTMEGRAIVREATLAEWKNSPDAGNEMHMDVVKQNLTLYEIPVYDGFHWGMAINLNACTGCGNCVISCQAENNVAVIGKEQVMNNRIMHWIRIDRYYSEMADNPEVMHQPVMCQHCDNAPCENVCPVAATPHSSEGLNQMSYNRCIGTRYCLNNCPYKVRRFNWFRYTDNQEFDFHMNDPVGKLVLNPDVTVRSRGVIEKCSFCVQRINEAKLKAKLENRQLKDGELKTACQQSCPGDAIVFGDMNDPGSEIGKLLVNPRTYQLLEQLHTLPSVNYLTRIWNKETVDKKENYRRTPYDPKHGAHGKEGSHGS